MVFGNMVWMAAEVCLSINSLLRFVIHAFEPAVLSTNAELRPYIESGMLTRMALVGIHSP